MEKRKLAILALIAAILTLAAVWYEHRPVAAQEATLAQVQAEAARGGYRLINTADLARVFQQAPNLLLVDTRQDWEYRSGHIKGAVNFPIEPTWWGRFRSRARLAALLGPDKDRPIFFY